jgi:tetratricopeptide (TPR) repeat protein
VRNRFTAGAVVVYLVQLAWVPCGRMLASPAEPSVRESDPVFDHRLRAARHLADEGGYAEAELAYRSALERTSSLPEPDRPRAVALDGIGYVLSAMGRYAEAETYYRSSAGILERVSATHPVFATVLVHLAEVAWKQGRAEEAERLCIRARRIQEAALGPADPQVLTTLANLAEVYRLRGRHQEAERFLLNILSVFQEKGETAPGLVKTLNILGCVYLEAGKFQQAEDTFNQALNTAGRDSEDAFHLLNNLGSVQFRAGQYGRAGSSFAGGEALAVRFYGPDHPSVATLLVNRAEALERLGSRAEAALLLRRAVEIQERSLGDSSPELARTLARYAGVLHKLGRRQEARAARARAAAIPQASGGGPTVSIGELQAALAKRGRLPNDSGRIPRDRPSTWLAAR